MSCSKSFICSHVNFLNIGRKDAYVSNHILCAEGREEHSFVQFPHLHLLCALYNNYGPNLWLPCSARICVPAAQNALWWCKMLSNLLSCTAGPLPQTVRCKVCMAVALEASIKLEVGWREIQGWGGRKTRGRLVEEDLNGKHAYQILSTIFQPSPHFSLLSLTPVVYVGVVRVKGGLCELSKIFLYVIYLLSQTALVASCG